MDEYGSLSDDYDLVSRFAQGGREGAEMPGIFERPSQEPITPPQAEPYRPEEQSFQPQPRQQSPQQMQPKPLPPIPLPFTQGDQIRLQRLQNGLAETQRQQQSGEIDQATADHYKGQILPQYQELLQKQQSHKQTQQQEQLQQQMHDAAQQQALRQANASSWAQGFPSTVAQITDPVTGRHAFLAQTPDGGWDEIKFEGHPQPLENETAQPSVMAATTEPEMEGGPTPPIPDVPPGEPVPFEQFAQQVTGQQSPQQAPGPRILNTAGQDITASQQAAYDRTRATPRDEWGRPTGPPPDVDTPREEHIYQEFFRRAQRAIPGPTRQELQGLDPKHQQEVLSHYRAQVLSMATHQYSEYQQNQRQKSAQAQQQKHDTQSQQAIADRHKEEIALKSQETRTTNELKTQAAAHQKDLDRAGRAVELRTKLYSHVGEQVEKEAKDFLDRSKYTDKDVPDWVKSEAGKNAEINRRLDAHEARLLPKEDKEPQPGYLGKLVKSLKGGKGGEGQANPPSGAAPKAPGGAEDQAKDFADGWDKFAKGGDLPPGARGDDTPSEAGPEEVSRIHGLTTRMIAEGEKSNPGQTMAGSLSNMWGGAGPWSKLFVIHDIVDRAKAEKRALTTAEKQRLEGLVAELPKSDIKPLLKPRGKK